MTNPAPPRPTQSRVASGRHQRRSVPRDLVVLARKLARVKGQARALGVFTDDRELLESPSCGLLEDVTSEGLLVTYPKDSVDLKDCGLRFKRVSETSFTCPTCGTSIKAGIL